MTKEIKIGESVVKMSANAFTPFVYKEYFHGDFIKEMNEFAKDENMEFISKCAWTLAKQAEPGLPELQEWLEQFELFDLIHSAPEIVALWGANMKTSAKPKKK